MSQTIERPTTFEENFQSAYQRELLPDEKDLISRIDLLDSETKKAFYYYGVQLSERWQEYRNQNRSVLENLFGSHILLPSVEEIQKAQDKKIISDELVSKINDQRLNDVAMFILATHLPANELSK